MRINKALEMIIKNYELNMEYRSSYPHNSYKCPSSLVEKICIFFFNVVDTLPKFLFVLMCVSY